MGQTTFKTDVHVNGGLTQHGSNSVYAVADGDNTLTLTAKDHGGKLITVLDATMVFTLPPSNVAADAGSDNYSPENTLGLTFKFLWLIDAANGTEINLDVASGDEFRGTINVGSETAGGNTAFQALSSDGFISIDMNGTTEGGELGTYIEITCVGDGLWSAHNSAVLGSGTLVSPFV